MEPKLKPAAAALALMAALAAGAPLATACSFAQPRVVTLPAQSQGNEAPPPAPHMAIDSIRRGGPASWWGQWSLSKSSCDGTGVIVLSIPADEQSRGLVYGFQVLSGAQGEEIFQPGVKQGFEYDGQLRFVFPWLDGDRYRQEPLDIKIRVTAYTLSGVAGGSTELRIQDPGR